MQKDRLAGVSPKSDQMFDQVATAAAFFRFLRQPSRPNAEAGGEQREGSRRSFQLSPALHKAAAFDLAQTVSVDHDCSPSSAKINIVTSAATYTPLPRWVISGHGDRLVRC